MTEVDKVSFSYIIGKPVIKDVSFTVSRGEAVFLLGVEGGGKTTLSKLLTGEIKNFEGNITIDSKDVKETKISDIDVGLITSDYLLKPNATVKTEVGYGLKLRGFDEAYINSAVDNILCDYNLSNKENDKIKNLNIIERFKVALARIVVRNPSLIVLDEVFYTVPIDSRIQLIRSIQSLLKSPAAAVIYMSSSLVEAEVFNSRLISLSYGEIGFDGKYSESQYSSKE